MTAEDLIQRLKSLGNSAFAEQSQRFFKTGPGQYGEGDVFLGIRVPVIRKEIQSFPDLSLTEIRKLLHSEFHEVRHFAVLWLVDYFNRSEEADRKRIFEFYVKEKKYINNWDLIDTTTHHIVGAWLFDKDRSILYEWVKSPQLWDRRMSVLACFYFIKKNDFTDILKISEALLQDKEDLIHKAVGWMLREMGKLDLDTERQFLKKHYQIMPRTMLRYAIERFEETERQAYLKGTI